MLIKYKTEPTIIVLSPNSANLIKILTQFVYSINIRYFSPPPLPCPVTLQGITNSMGERLLFNPLPLCFRREYRGSAHRARGLKKRRGLKKHRQQQNQISHSPLAVPRSIAGCFAQQNIGEVSARTEGLIKQRGLEYKQKQQSPIPPLSGGEDARKTEGKGRGLFERSEFRRPRRRP